MGSGTIIIMGDICAANGFAKDITGTAFDSLRPVLEKADVVLANLESPLTLSQEKLYDKRFGMKGYPSDAAVLAKAGINGVSLANNHILDYNTQGYRDTIRALDDNGIFHYGSGAKNEVNMPRIIHVNQKRIGVLAFAEHEFNSAEDYGEGAFIWEDLTGPQIVADAKKQCDFLIIQFHGGTEHYIYPSPNLQKRCRMMADMGADFITCQHSHCIGAKENRNGCEILYGQGNSVFGYEKGNDKWNEGLLVQLSIDEKPEIRYIPIVATPDGVAIANAERTESILNNMRIQSEKIADDGFVASEWTQYCKSHASFYLPAAFAYGRLFIKLNIMTKGLLIRLFTNSKSRKKVINLIRCDAHREALETMLKNDLN